MGEESINASKLLDKFYGCLFSDTGATRIIISGVTHECEKINDLFSGRDTIFFFYFLFSHLVISASMARPTAQNPVS